MRVPVSVPAVSALPETQAALVYAPPAGLAHVARAVLVPTVLMLPEAQRPVVN